MVVNDQYTDQAAHRKTTSVPGLAPLGDAGPGCGDFAVGRREAALDAGVEHHPPTVDEEWEAPTVGHRFSSRTPGINARIMLATDPVATWGAPNAR